MNDTIQGQVERLFDVMQFDNADVARTKIKILLEERIPGSIVTFNPEENTDSQISGSLFHSKVGASFKELQFSLITIGT